MKIAQWTWSSRVAHSPFGKSPLIEVSHLPFLKAPLHSFLHCSFKEVLVSALIFILLEEKCSFISGAWASLLLCHSRTHNARLPSAQMTCAQNVLIIYLYSRLKVIRAIDNVSRFHNEQWVIWWLFVQPIFIVLLIGETGGMQMILFAFYSFA
jgi:hypothetical protein